MNFHLTQTREWLHEAQNSLQANIPLLAKAELEAAMLNARKLRNDIPRNRCLRAYIAQAIQAMEQANANT